MAWPNYEMKKDILRILTVMAGLFCILPAELNFLEYKLLDVIQLRMILGAAAIFFAVGSWKKWW